MKPNIPLFMKVCDTIMKHPTQFDITEWDCGTTACIAGWALRLSGKSYNDKGLTSVDAADLLSIDHDQGYRLFMSPEAMNLCRTAPEAVAFIHKFLDEEFPGWWNNVERTL